MFRNLQNLKNKILRNFRNIRAGGPKIKIKNGSSTIPKARKFNFQGRFLRLGLIFLGIVIFVGAIYFATMYFNFKTVTFDASTEKPSALRNSEELNVLFLVLDDRLTDYKFVQNATVISSNSRNAVNRVISIDTNYLVNYNAQRNKLFSVFNNLPADSEFDRLNFIKRAVSVMIGVRIDKYIVVNASEYKKICSNELQLNSDQMADVFEKFNLKTQNEVVIKTLLKLSTFANVIDRFYNNDTFNSLYKTDLIGHDFNYFVGLFASIGDKSIQSVEINKSMINEEDKNGIYIPNYTLVDDSVKKIFRDIDILKEQVRVELYNSTTQAGLATTYKRLLENNNMNIIKFGNYPEILDKTTLFIVNPENLSLYTNTLATLRRNIPIEIKVTTEDYKYNSSGDIILVLGNDVNALDAGR